MAVAEPHLLLPLDRADLCHLIWLMRRRSTATLLGIQAARNLPAHLALSRSVRAVKLVKRRSSLTRKFWMLGHVSSRPTAHPLHLHTRVTLHRLLLDLLLENHLVWHLDGADEAPVLRVEQVIGPAVVTLGMSDLDPETSVIGAVETGAIIVTSETVMVAHLGELEETTAERENAWNLPLARQTAAGRSDRNQVETASAKNVESVTERGKTGLSERVGVIAKEDAKTTR